MHDSILPEWYLEIGTQTGRSLLPAGRNCIAIDPDFVLKFEVIGTKSSLFLFQETSDNFFETNFMPNLGHAINMAFLDGMHLYDFLLRDFINAEKYMSPDGVIVMHDCLPYDPLMAQRDRRKAPTRAWCGDVWKIVPILQKYRPDLSIDIYDAAPTGLVTVRNLDPGNEVLSTNYDAIEKEFLDAENVTDYVREFSITDTALSPWRQADVAEVGNS